MGLGSDINSYFLHHAVFEAEFDVRNLRINNLSHLTDCTPLSLIPHFDFFVQVLETD